MDSGGYRPQYLGQEHFAIFDHYLEAYLRALQGQDTLFGFGGGLVTCGVTHLYDFIKGGDQTFGTNAIWVIGEILSIPDMNSHSPTTSQANFTSIAAMSVACIDYSKGVWARH